ncbi:MAG TPA: HAMP domain-containing sensor histidine kinase [Solirubrobacterales bacterium]|nr:HAMP domain-containing sensor histidine kinase [Solirubrobacterales bacterium]
MRTLSPSLIAAVSATLGAVLALILGIALLGWGKAEGLILPLAIAIAVTVTVTGLAARWLSAASLRLRFVFVAAFATAIGLANLGALVWLMLLDDHDAALVAALLAFSAAAAIGAGLAGASTSTQAIERLSGTARRLADGDLEARVGAVGGGPELDALGATLDEMTERLGDSLRRERAAEAQRRDLIIAVSHDLRTPLAGLRAMAEALEDGIVDDSATVRVYTARIAGAVGQLSELVDDLFEFVQLDADAIEAEATRARLDEVVSAAVAACDLQAAEKGLRLRAELGDAAAAPCSPRLGRVLQNLLQNAIRHTPADGSVLVEARQAGRRVELAVEDSGEGIDPEAIERVFEPFWRGDAARATQGAGLGLALSKRIVEALGGTIAVESQPDRGSRFSVRLPVSVDAAADTGATL